jgi:hypothetical protein
MRIRSERRFPQCADAVRRNITHNAPRKQTAQLVRTTMPAAPTALRTMVEATKTTNGIIDSSGPRVSSLACPKSDRDNDRWKRRSYAQN